MPTCGSSSSPITTPTSPACPPIPPGPWSGSARLWTSIRAPGRGRRAAGGARPCREVRRRGFAGRPAARPAPLRGAARHRAAAPHRRTYGQAGAPGLGPLRRPGPPARGPPPPSPEAPPAPAAPFSGIPPQERPRVCSVGGPAAAGATISPSLQWGVIARRLCGPRLPVKPRRASGQIACQNQADTLFVNTPVQIRS